MHKFRKISLILILFSLVCTISSCHQTDSLAPLRKDLSQYITHFDATIGVAVLTDDGDSLTINNACHYPMMSVFKFHQALAVANYLNDYQLSLSSQIPLDYTDLIVNTYSPMRDKYPQGGNLMVSELLQYTLQLSDNIAADILFNVSYHPNQVDSLLKAKSKILDFNIAYNETQMQMNNGLCYDNWSTPYATVELLNQFLQGKLTDEPYTSFIKQLMIDSKTGENRLPRYISNPKVTIGHKSGSGYATNQSRLSAINDVGFVILPSGKYYSIAVYIKEAALTQVETENIIAEISKRVYKYLEE